MTFWIAFGITIFVAACWLAYDLYNAPLADENENIHPPCGKCASNYWCGLCHLSDIKHARAGK